MKAEDLRAYAARDWQLVRASKDAYLDDRIASMGATESLRLAGELTAFLRTARPDWPTAEERAEDLATHTRVANALRRTAIVRRS